MQTLQEVIQTSGLQVHDHIDQSVEIPVLNGLQCQGDLIIIPTHTTPAVNPVEANGVEVIRGEAERNSHTLHADKGTARWYPHVKTRTDDLTLGHLQVTDKAWLIHAEHGANGIAAGTYEIRRQKEFSPEGTRMVLD